MAEWNSFSYICTRALHSFLCFVHCRAASTVIPLLPNATFLPPSIWPNLGLPCSTTYSCHQLPSGHMVLIDSFQMPKPTQYSLACCTCNSLSIPAFLHTSSFLTLLIHDTPIKLLTHFISRTITFLLSLLLTKVNLNHWTLMLYKSAETCHLVSLPCKGTNILIFVTCGASFYLWVWSVQPPYNLYTHG